MICYLSMYRNLIPKLLPGKGRLNSDSTEAFVKFLIFPEIKRR